MAETETSSRFWWLWQNKFYETTGLTGWLFIYNAKTKVEALLWYAIILVLAVFTINNVNKLVIYYRSNPTKTEVRISSNASDATIGNFKFKLALPVIEIHSATTLNYWESYGTDVKPLSCGGRSLMDNMVKAAYWSSVCLPLHIHPLISTYTTDIPDSLRNLTNYIACQMMPRDPLNLTYTTSIIETEKLVQNLNNRFSKKLNSIWSTMATYNKTNYKKNLKKAVANFMNLMKENVDRNFFTPFLLLKSMSDATIHNDLPFIELFNATQYFEHSALSPDQILEEMSNRLFDIAPFVLPPSLSDTKFFIRDWNTDFVEEAVNVVSPEYGQFQESFTLEFEVRPPAGTQEFTMDINPPKQLINFLFPFVHMDDFLFDLWFYGAFSGTPFQYFPYNLLSCDITESWSGDIDFSWSLFNNDWLADYYLRTPRTKFLEMFVYPAVDFYKKQSELKVNTGGGTVTLKPFLKHHINLLPTGRMMSQTDDCISITFDDCLDLCQSNYTVEKCDCHPWNLHHLHTQSGVAICTEPCPGLPARKILCLSECDQSSAHPCDRIIYRPENTNQPISVLEEKEIYQNLLSEGQSIIDDKFKLFSLKITIEPIMAYVKTVESYEMTFTNFISEFGGLVDFWLGINLIGIIHAFVYFLKQCRHCNREHKTGRTVRQLVACTNEVGPMQEEQNGTEVTINMLVMMQQQMDGRLTEIMKEMRNQNKRSMSRKTEAKIVKKINIINKRIKHIEDRREKY